MNVCLSQVPNAQEASIDSKFHVPGCFFARSESFVCSTLQSGTLDSCVCSSFSFLCSTHSFLRQTTPNDSHKTVALGLGVADAADTGPQLHHLRTPMASRHAGPPCCVLRAWRVLGACGPWPARAIAQPRRGRATRGLARRCTRRHCPRPVPEAERGGRGACVAALALEHATSPPWGRKFWS
jgi:hypothetical protein